MKTSYEPSIRLIAAYYTIREINETARKLVAHVNCVSTRFHVIYKNHHMIMARELVEQNSLTRVTQQLTYCNESEEYRRTLIKRSII